MRVIGGRFRSRRLKSVPGLAVRPTPDRLREALFNVLAPRLEAAIFVDAYAGSGAVGIEALSRGASRVFLIERNQQALAVIEQNLRSLGIGKEVTVLRGRAALLLRECSADIVFLDPPYEDAGEYENSLSAIATTACPLVIAQHARRFTLADAYGDLHKTRDLSQGDNSLAFYSRAATT